MNWQARLILVELPGYWWDDTIAGAGAFPSSVGVVCGTIFPKRFLMPDNQTLTQLPPLQGCLVCHAEEATSLSEPRKLFGFGHNYPVLRCSQCGAVALLDASLPDEWRINYRRLSRDPAYYYVAVHFGKAGWLSAQQALTISTDGFVQRQRVRQARMSDLGWLRPKTLNPPPPVMDIQEQVFLTLKGVTYQDASVFSRWGRSGGGDLLDSGKLYVTDRALHLLGQRRNWSHALADIQRVTYDRRAWTIVLSTPSHPQQYRGVHVSDQFDPQLVATIVEALREVLAAEASL